MTERPDAWALDGGMAVTPAGGGADAPVFTISSPTASDRVEATAYQLQLLLAFAEGAEPEGILDAYPFDKDDSRRFLLRCRQVGLLRPLGIHGRAEAPERVGVSPRFIGAPLFDPATPAAFTFLGIPFDGNTTGFPGARFGPAAVRAASEGIRFTIDPFTRLPVGFHDYARGVDRLRGVGFADAGDVHVSPGEDGPELYARVTDVVRDLLEVGTIPLVVGGDHSLSASVLAAFPDAPLQIVHFDAHTDLGEVERTDGTGLHHGNVFSVVLQSLPHVAEIRQVGLRGWIEASAVGVETRATGIGIDRLREIGAEAALDGLDPERPTYVSIDIDVLDPAFAPSTGTPVHGGMAPDELRACLGEVGRRFTVVGVDLMEVARPLGPHDGAAGIAVEALLTLADATCERTLTEMAAAGGPGDNHE